MEQTHPESNIQNNQKQIINPDNQIRTQQIQEDNNSSNQNEIINPQKNSSEVNSSKKPQLTKENKVSNINHNITQQEQNPLLIEEQSKDIHNLPQNNNIEYTSLQTAKNTNQQINNQYMINYQNIMPIHNQELNQELNQFQPQQNLENDYQENKNIYDYSTNMNLFGIAFQNGNNLRLAISSLEKIYDNKIEILELIDNELKNVFEQKAVFPCTKLLWSPNTSKNSLLAFSSDTLQIYDYSEEKKSLFFQTKLNNIKSKYCGPLTSFDWNRVNDAFLGTASLDTTCTIWDLNKLSIKTQLIAHDKEVFDIKFGNEENIFISGGADGSVRLFDLRNLDHSTIIYEIKGNFGINKLAWNSQNSNLIAALCLDKSLIYIFDSRMNNNVSLDELNLHKEPVTGCVWAPDNPIQLCSVSEDCNVIISNVINEISQSNNVSYNAPYPINNVDWCKSFPEWIGITFRNRVQLLRK